MGAARDADKGRTLRIRVNAPGKTEVNIVLPLGYARLGLKFNGIAVKDELTKHGIDLEQLLRDADTAGQLVDSDDNGTHVEISVV
jgi:hypothetical protein